MSIADADFVRKAQKGEQEAFSILVDRHRDVVFSICFGRSGNFADAQDLAQESFVKAFAHLEQLRDEERFAAWLYRITYAVCGQWRRGSKKPSLSLDEAIATPLDSISVEDELIRHETRDLIAHVLQALPENQRLATTLHYFCGYSYEEIARITQTSPAIIKTRLQRARKSLRDRLFDVVFEDSAFPKPSKSLTRKVLSGLDSFEKEDIFSHLRALKALLEFLGERVNWDYLLGSSGEAFSLYFSPRWNYLWRFMHTWDVLNAGSRPFGYSGKWLLDQDFEVALDVIEKSLEAGIPVLAPGINPASSADGGSESHFFFVVRGLDRKRETLVLSGAGAGFSVVPYPFAIRDGRKTFRWHGIVRCLDVHSSDARAKNPLLCLVRDESPEDADEVALRSIERAVALSREGPVRLSYSDDEASAGVAAVEAWSKALRQTVLDDLRHPVQIKEVFNHFGTVMHSMSKRIEVNGRAAAAYLHELAERYSWLPSGEMLEAANRYELAAGLSRKVFDLFFEFEEEAALMKAVGKLQKPDYYESQEVRAFWSTFSERFFGDASRREQAAELVADIAKEHRQAVRCLSAVDEAARR